MTEALYPNLRAEIKAQCAGEEIERIEVNGISITLDDPLFDIPANKSFDDVSDATDLPSTFVWTRSRVLFLNDCCGFQVVKWIPRNPENCCEFPGCNRPALGSSGNFGGGLVCSDHFKLTNGTKEWALPR